MTGANAAEPRGIVTVYVEGRPARHPRENRARLVALQAVIDAAAAWGPIDALLLPAGYFSFKTMLDHSDPADAVGAIEASPLGAACRSVVARLAEWSPGAPMVVGIESRHQPAIAGTQTVVAWSPSGIVGFARKIYPTSADSAPGARRRLLIHAADFGDRRRFITLPSGRKAVLAVCYDAFGFAMLHHLAPDVPGLRWLERDGRRLDPVPRPARSGLAATWCVAVREEAPDLALVAIHGFERPGRDTYWQRHGIATASASLGGALVLGAAHIRRGLRCDAFSALSAREVPVSHTVEGNRRLAWRTWPSQAFNIFSSHRIVACYYRQSA